MPDKNYEAYLERVVETQAGMKGPRIPSVVSYIKKWCRGGEFGAEALTTQSLATVCYRCRYSIRSNKFSYHGLASPPPHGQGFPPVGSLASRGI